MATFYIVIVDGNGRCLIGWRPFREGSKVSARQQCIDIVRAYTIGEVKFKLAFIKENIKYPIKIKAVKNRRLFNGISKVVIETKTLYPEISTKTKVEMIKELRSKTGRGMMNCKRALVETDWNPEKAYELIKTYRRI